jgi:outer membrane protein
MPIASLDDPSQTQDDDPRNPVRSSKHRMNRTLVFATVLAAGLTTATLGAQTAAAPAAAAPAAAVPPQALPAKIAIIAFDQVVLATNEGQKAIADVQKKYEPQKAKIDTQAGEVENLRKQLQALPPTTPDDERAKRLQAIDKLEKQLNLDAENANNAYQEDLQKSIGPIYQKVGQTAVKYAQENGFTLIMNSGGQQQASPMLWWNPATDISQAVVTAYNTSSGIAAPPPSAPSATRRPTPTTPKK